MTQQYVGTKIVTAWEATGQNGAPGYSVKYADGYTSWSPKDVFESTYLALGHIDHLASHEQRLVAEYTELATKLRKLFAFLNSDKSQELDNLQRDLLVLQSAYMSHYADILVTRLKLIKNSTEQLSQ